MSSEYSKKVSGIVKASYFFGAMAVLVSNITCIVATSIWKDIEHSVVYGTFKEEMLSRFMMTIPLIVCTFACIFMAYGLKRADERR